MPAGFDRRLELFAGGVGRDNEEQRIELGVEPGAVGLQGGVGEPLAAATDLAGPLQQVLQAGGKRDVAGVDSILGVADEMGEADLVIGLGPAHLRAVAVGHPNGGAHVAEEVRHQVLAAAVADHEAAVLVVMEGPQPPVLLADPDARLVRLQHRAGEQAGADQAPLPGERRPAVGQHIDQRAFADRKPEQIGHQPRQPLERDGVHEAQIDRESPQVRPERRARRHVGRRLRPEGRAAARAQPAMQRHPRDLRLDLWNLDMVIGVERRLRDARHVAPAMPASIDQNIAAARRIRMQRTMRAGMRCAGAFAPACRRPTASSPARAACSNCPASSAADQASPQAPPPAPRASEPARSGLPCPATQGLHDSSNP